MFAYVSDVQLNLILIPLSSLNWRSPCGRSTSSSPLASARASVARLRCVPRKRDRSVSCSGFGFLVDHRGGEVSWDLELRVEHLDRRPTTKPSAKALIAASSTGFSRALLAA
jgi:hypothetical protein